MGTKYGRQHDLTSRREAARLAALPEEGTWETPADEDCDGSDDLRFYPTETTRITTHLRYQAGKVAYYAIMHDVLERGEWLNVTRIDCKHKTVHQHFFDSNGTQMGTPNIIQPLHSDKDVDDSYLSSYSLIADNVEHNERKWRDA